MKKIYFILTLVLLSTLGFSQEGSLFVQIDKKVYFTGDIIWFSGHVKTEDVNEIAYFQIINEDGGVELTQKILVDKNRFNGNIKIPQSIVTDRYILIIRTRFGWSYEYIWIVNSNDDDETFISLLKKGFDRKAEYSEGEITINSNLSNQKRASSSMNITVKDANGNPIQGELSIAILDKSQLGYSNFTSGDSGPIVSKVPMTGYIAPISIKADIVNKEGAEFVLESPKVLQLVFWEKGYSVFVDTDGKIYIPLEQEFYGTKELFFVNYEDLKYVGLDMQIKFEKVDPPLLFEQSNQEVSGDIITFINNYKKKSSIEKAFSRDINPYKLNDTTDKFQSGIRLLDKPDQSVLIDNFLELPNLREVFREIVSTIKVRYIDDKFEMRIFSEEMNKYYNDNPLIIIDNVPEPNLAAVMELEPSKIAKLEVLQENSKLFRYGFLARNGVLFIETKSGDYKSNVPRYLVPGFHKPMSFPTPNYNTEGIDNEIPNLNSTVFWSPSTQTNQQGKATIEFLNSDNPGDYIVEIYFIGENGEKITLRQPLNRSN